MKKYIALLLIVILLLACCVPAMAYDVPGQVKVGLLYDGSSPSSAVLSSAAGLSFGIENGGSYTAIGHLSEKTVNAARTSAYFIQSTVGYANYDEADSKAADLKAQGVSAFPFYIDWKYYIACGPYYDSGSAQTAARDIQGVGSVEYSVVSPLANSYLLSSTSGKAVALFRSTVDSLILIPDDGVIRLNNTPYRGNMILFTTAAGTTNVVNLVDMERYIASVIAKEMSPSFPLEALKAQAVAARTFAARTSNKYPGKGFQMTNTTADQVYYGMDAEAQRTDQAAAETAGQILMYNGAPIEAVYSATSGGRTESSVNVWGGDLPYLKSVEDPYEPADKASYYTWEITLSKGEIKQILASKGVNIGDITDVRPLEFSDAGRVLRLAFVGTAGTKEYTKDACRTVFGGKLPSQWYTVKRPGVLQTVTGSGRQDASLSGACIATGNGLETLPFGTSQMTVISVSGTSIYSTQGDSFVFSGRGYGHGIGMSSWGAYGMAQAGHTYEKILLHYYTGVYLTEKR